MNRGNLIRGAFEGQESDRVPPHKLPAAQVTAGVAAGNVPRVASRLERVICEVQTATSVLSPKERAELALGFFLAAMETLGWDEPRIVLEIRKAFAARGAQQ